MNRRFPRAKWVLPAVIDPPTRLCFTIEVPNDPAHIAAFRGALWSLASAIAWQDDLEHKAKDVAKVWRAIYDAVEACPIEENSMEGVLNDDMSDNIRVKPGNNCILQMKCCGEWVDFWDISECIAQALGQPTSPGEIEPGACQMWHVSLRGNDKWLLPVLVNEGDSIQVTNAQGAWNDGTIGWNCVNGMTFFGGVCVAAEAAEATDPLQTVNHMRLIENIGGAWWDAYNTTQYVLPVVVNGEVWFQANDGSLEDNSGTVSFDVTYCKAQAAPVVIDISASVGSLNKSSVGLNEVFTLTFADLGGGNCGAAFTTDVCCKIEVLGYTNWTLPATVASWTRNKCEGGTESPVCSGTNTCLPSMIDPSQCSLGYNFGFNPTPATLPTVTFRITEVC